MGGAYKVVDLCQCLADNSLAAVTNTVPRSHAHVSGSP